MQLLTLDETTLFYYSLSQGGKKTAGSVASLLKDWSNGVTAGAAPSNTSHVSSAISSEVAIISKPKSAATTGIVKGKGKNIVKEEPVEEETAGFVDEDKMQGVERDQAVNSPIKGNAKLDSAVRLVPCR